MTTEQIESIVRQNAFPFPSEQTHLIETHISWVILTDTHAFKIKKPIVYSFLDFSSLEHRCLFCRREVRLNRRLTDGMYLGVAPIRQTPQGFQIGGTQGAIVDYALLMRRMDETRSMDRLLRLGGVTREHIRCIAGQLAAFHRQADRIPGGEQAADLQEKFADLLTVRDFLRQEMGAAAAHTADDLVDGSRRFLTRHAERLRRRNQLGWVVDGHGDLHSKNIFLLDRPVIFDCIEFNDEYRQLDLLNEVAFFCMDLDYYRHEYLAEAFLSDYLNRMSCLKEEADLRLFHFYKLYRAGVRLKVNCLRAMQPESKDHEKTTRQAVRDYLGLVRRYADLLPL